MKLSRLSTCPGQFDWTNDSLQCASLSSPPLKRDIGDHTKQILAADLQFPIVISTESNVMDGLHRIPKCYAFGLHIVRAVQSTRKPDARHGRAQTQGEPRQYFEYALMVPGANIIALNQHQH